MSGPPVTVAVSTYDRHAPLFDGRVRHPDFDFQFRVSSQSDGLNAFERFLAGEWDVAEFSFSSYLIAKDLGLPIHAVPIFPRRLFSQSQLYKNKNAGIESPADLAGRRVALNSYQTTLCVLAKGDLAHYYDVPWKEINFVTSREGPIEVPLPADLKLEKVGSPEQIEEELVAGTIVAQFSPGPPRAYIEGNPNVVRLFDNPWEEEQRHLLSNPGYFPIMHVLAYQQPVAERYPELPQALFDVFEEARGLARARWNDPNYSVLLWGKPAFEQEKALYKADPWLNGLEVNWKNIEEFSHYSQEQGLIQKITPPDELFAAVAVKGEAAAAARV